MAGEDKVGDEEQHLFAAGEGGQGLSEDRCTARGKAWPIIWTDVAEAADRADVEAKA